MRVATPPAWWKATHARTMRKYAKAYDGMRLRDEQRLRGEHMSWALRRNIAPPLKPRASRA